MYKDGWWLSWMMPRTPWKVDPETLKRFAPGVWDPATDPIELYYLPDDFTQARNIADQHPEKVEELQQLFWQEAEKYQVLPLLGGLTSFFGIPPPIPTESRFTYYGDVQNVASGMIPRSTTTPTRSAPSSKFRRAALEGVIVAEADHLGGFALFVQDGKLRHTYSFLGVQEFRQESDTPLPSGAVNVRMEFAADAPKPATGGEVTLFVNDEPVGGGRIEHTVPARFSGYAGMDIGRDNGLPVDRAYADKSPFAFTGKVKKVVFDINPHLEDAHEQELHEHSHQALAARTRSTPRTGANMSDEHKDVLIAVYLFEDLAEKDFDTVLKLAEDKTITVEGVVLVQKNADGEVHVKETGDHLGRKGAKLGGGVGLVVGLFAPPLLAVTAIGAAGRRSPGEVREAPARKRASPRRWTPRSRTAPAV